MTSDKNTVYPIAIEELKKDKSIPDSMQLRQQKYLNSIVEQDHRFIKKRIRSMIGFKTFRTAKQILYGVEVMHIMNLQKKKIKSSLIVAYIMIYIKLWYNVKNTLRKKGFIMRLKRSPGSVTRNRVVLDLAEQIAQHPDFRKAILPHYYASHRKILPNIKKYEFDFRFLVEEKDEEEVFIVEAKPANPTVKKRLTKEEKIALHKKLAGSARRFSAEGIEESLRIANREDWEE